MPFANFSLRWNRVYMPLNESIFEEAALEWFGELGNSGS